MELNNDRGFASSNASHHCPACAKCIDQRVEYVREVIEVVRGIVSPVQLAAISERVECIKLEEIAERVARRRFREAIAERVAPRLPPDLRRH
ncbi:hypothetical protein [Opitutus sp. ER46]|uniref:hypothetical protein n=1 Tax=Opitutus sp. ER46 TaxID=2161864 RepID=UPI000D325294|nr:hypothetical protein [Opitutus sp. ER46]PTX96575.1 hypothetical protein DB354_07925 [Opitutus sp. ER46]